VRQDILDQLKLREPHKYIASFHRDNLRYIAHKCDKSSHGKMVLRAASQYANESMIVYAGTIADVERLVDELGDNGIPAIPYHGKMETARRRKNQERWMNDEVRVLVGTVAFGLGINKPAVRAVLHTCLPKSVEQYYQEAGRAGRDGLPADCLLLWQPKDTALLAYFIDQLTDPEEKRRAWARYRTILNFVEGDRCRHHQICLHFGQTPKWERCEMCDVCGNAPEWLLEPVEEAEHPKKKRRTKKEAARPEPVAKPKVAAAPAPRAAPVPRPAARPAVEDDLVRFFKEWRKRIAQRAAVPAYVVLSDAALEDLCAKRPTNLRELLAVTGVGERKAELYGSEIFAALEEYRKGARAAAQQAAQASPAEETIRLLREGKSFDEIAAIRGRQVTTVVNMVADLVEKGRLAYRVEWVGEADHRQIEETVMRLGSQWLKPLRDALPAQITYDQIRLVVAAVRSGESGQGS
jgi:ATP-dependent DNA helicase RecQ